MLASGLPRVTHFTPVEIAMLGAFMTIASTACGAAMAGTFLAITTIMGG